MHEIDFEYNLQKVQERIERACQRASRDPAEVKLVAVSKKKPPECVAQAVECGLRVFGESRVQEAAAKISMCPSHLSWHLIGHLQRNKVRRAVQLFEMIHSVDSLRLMQALEGACAAAGRQMAVLLEVNVSGEAAKHGMTPDVLHSVLEASLECPHLDVLGLMTIPPWSDDVEKTRVHFRALRELRDKACREWDFPMDELSMGMSNDFEVAIEEGATWVRVGSDLFGERRA